MPGIRLIAASRLFVRGAVIPGRGLLIEGSTIAAVAGIEAPGPIAAMSGRDEGPACLEVDDFPGATLIPGLVDAHVHLCLGHDEDLHRAVDPDLVARSTARGRVVAEGLLAAGVTSARDLGCRADSAQRVRDALSGREISLVVAGQPVTSPGGHFASFGIPISTPEEAVKAVEALVAKGADLVKVMATGGILTPHTHPGRAQFGVEVVRSLTSRAHALGRRVAAHAHGTEGIAIAVEAGADTIEHCTWLEADGGPGAPTVDLVQRMAEGGQTVVIAGPMPDGLVRPDGSVCPMPTSDPERLAALRRSWRNAALMREAGVRVALGTDSFFGQFPDMKDLAYRAEAMVGIGGWDPVDVLDLVTEGGAAALGEEGSLGRLAPGARADVVVVDGDPSVDVGALRRVLAVYRRGERVV